MTRVFYKAGHELAVWKGFFWHRGIATGDLTVVTTTPKHGTHEQSEYDFASGKPIQDRGYRGNLPPLSIVANARAQIGRPYCVLSNNCDHLVREAQGLKRESSQLQTWVAAGLLVATAVLIARKARA